MQKKAKNKKDNSERWLLTYADLITLLMILFILLYAISNINQAKYDQLSESLSNSMGKGASLNNGSSDVLLDSGDTPIDLGGTGSGSGNDSGSAPSISTAPSPSLEPTQAPEESSQNGQDSNSGNGDLGTKQEMTDFESHVKQILKDLNLDAYANTIIEDRGLVISFNNDIFFDSGQDALKDEMKKGLSQIAKLLNTVNNKIIIEGYTDNVPLGPDNKFSSNWQLSAARAANVAQYLADKENVTGSRVSAAGFGEYRPVASNDTAEGRNKNRRVDIVILYNNVQE